MLTDCANVKSLATPYCHTLATPYSHTLATPYSHTLATPHCPSMWATASAHTSMRITCNIGSTTSQDKTCCTSTLVRTTRRTQPLGLTNDATCSTQRHTQLSKCGLRHTRCAHHFSNSKGPCGYPGQQCCRCQQEKGSDTLRSNACPAPAKFVL